MNMDFGANEASVEVIKKETFGRTYFRDIYSAVYGKWYNKNAYTKSWKEFHELENIDKNIIAQIIMMLMLINMVLNVEHH